MTLFNSRQISNFLTGRPGYGLRLIAVLLALWGGYVLSGQPLTLLINGRPYPVRVHRLTVAGMLSELGLTLAPADVVEPPLPARLAPGQTVTVKLARPVLIEADGRTQPLMTHQSTVAGVLAEARLTAADDDEILVDGALVAGQSRLPTTPAAPEKLDAAGFLLPARTPGEAITSARPKLVQLTIRRAIPVTLDDGGVRSTFFTTRP
ncbi:MAG: ubiquitin-like domain-containing protein, partial [Chloroflexota bacterium]